MININVSNNQYVTYLNNLINQIQSLEDCSSLNSIETESWAIFQSMISQVESQISILGPLANIPTDLPSLIKWVTNYINNNIIKPYENAITLEAQLLLDLQKIMNLVNGKYIGMNCSYIPLSGIVYNIKTTADQLTGNILMGGF
jgi:hypothetical protein